MFTRADARTYYLRTMGNRFFLLLVITAFYCSAGAQDTAQKITPGRKNDPAQQQKPYVILISADGFRYDYATKHGAPNLLSLAKQGVQAEYMLPSWPTLTFPNHYTIATGLYPSHHGLVDNQFYDRATGEQYTMSNPERVRNGKWYGGVPLWVLAEQHGMLSASFYWPGTEAAINGISPSYYFHYNTKISIDRRIRQVVDWLQLPPETRPHFISFYFPEADHEGHAHGPDAWQTREAVRFIDSAVAQLVAAVKKTGLNVNFIFVADHGMTLVDTLRPLSVPVLDSSRAFVSWGGELVQVYVKNKNDIAAVYQELKHSADGYSVLLKDSMPPHLHYSTGDDVVGRMGDIILMAEPSRVFVAPGKKPKTGAHGFDPRVVPDMRTVFYAWGPAFRKGRVIAPFVNVDVYPVITSILGLTYQHVIDGSDKVAREILVK